MKKCSLSHKLIMVFSTILISVVFLNMFFNALLLSKVYRNKKINSMEDLYSVLWDQYQQEKDFSTITETVKSILSKENLRVFIWDSDDNLVIDSFPLIDEYSKNKENQSPRPNKKSDLQSPDRKNDMHWKYFGRFEHFILYSEIKEDNLIFKNSDYEIFSEKNYASNAEEENFFLRGQLPRGYKVLIQMPVASVDEAVGVSNSLLLLVGTIMLLIGISIVFITSRSIAKPVKELSDIALSMKNLDFSLKYTGERKDEIGSLGQSINALSDKLKETIDELCEKNEELRLDNEIKSHIDDMRKEFIANASHELKTPVALISGYAEGLRDNIASNEAMKNMYTDVIIEETEKINHIIRQMLDLMELDSTEDVFEKELISVNALVEDVLNSFEVLIKSKGIKMEVILDECSISGDYWRIHQAVTNYISNAINHVDDKKAIKISVIESCNRVKFSVYNSGANISEGDLERIWERFYKVDKSHSRQYGGSGLGLAVVRSIIELHKGKCGVINHPEGVEFYFIIEKENNDEN